LEEEAGTIFKTKKPEDQRAVEYYRYIVPANYEPEEPTRTGDDGKGILRFRRGAT